MERIIWTMWWQGEENAPLPIRLGIASMRRHANGAKVIVVTEENYRQYTTIPDHIMDKVKSGQIRLVHLSDVLRSYLLRDNGGLWIDGTVLLMKDIPDWAFDLELYTLNHKMRPGKEQTNITKGRWCSFFFGGSKNNLIFDAMCNFYSEYWKTNKIVIDYLLIDYVIELFYEEYESVRKSIDAVPPMGGYLWDLNDRKNELSDIDSIDGMYQKLSWRMSYQVKTPEGLTLFGKVLKDYDMLNDDVQDVSDKELFSIYIKRIPKLRLWTSYRSFGAKYAILNTFRILVLVFYRSEKAWGPIQGLAIKIQKAYQMTVFECLRRRSGSV